MAFENMATWGMTWGYVFVIVIAGLALLVGKKKRDKRKAKADTAKATETSPELEQVETKPEESQKDQADGKESEKTE